MSTEFYIKDKQGTYLSEDNDIRYRKLEGKELYEFLQTDEGKKKNFHIEVDENGDKLGIEVESTLDAILVAKVLRNLCGCTCSIPARSPNVFNICLTPPLFNG